MKNKKSFPFLLKNCLLFLFCSLFLNACVVSGGVSTRGMPRSLEVEQMFLSGQLLPDYTYYMQGTYPEPEAIMALSNSVQLQSRLWSKVDWTEKELKTAAFWMENSEMGFCTTDGGYLLAPDGRKIGIWYSQRDTSVVKEPTPGVIEVYPFDFGSNSSCRRHYLRDQI